MSKKEEFKIHNKVVFASSIVELVFFAFSIVEMVRSGDIDGLRCLIGLAAIAYRKSLNITF